MRGHPEFQRTFAAGLVSGTLPDGVTARDPAEAVLRYGVYRNNVRYSLSQALAVRFPVTARLVGDAFFAQMAGTFADKHRPQTPILMLWGDAFPGFLAAFPPLADYPYMADVARVELARGVAYHAADDTPLGPDALQAIAAAGGNAAIPLHASVQAILSDHPVFTIWHSHQPGQTPAAIKAGGAECALILRDRAFDVQVHRISPADAAMIAALQAGDTLLQAASAAAAKEPAHDPSILLALLFQAGALVGDAR